MSAVGLSLAGFARCTLVALALLALALFLWDIRDVLLLAFGSVVIAAILDALADPLERRLGLPQKTSVLVAALVLIAVIAVLVLLFGSQIQAQTLDLIQRLPASQNTLRQAIKDVPLGSYLESRFETLMPSGGNVLMRLVNVVNAFVFGLLDLLLVLFGGIYLALQPELYRQGFLKLVPGEAARRETEEALLASGEALKLWLVAKLISMTTVGVLVGLGTWWLGLPSPLALGLIAGLAAFVPFFGPLAGAVPALLLAVTVGWTEVLWTAGLFVAVEQVESNIVLPLAQQHTVSLPPALAIFAVVGFGLTFGLLGILFGTPLAVVALVLVKRLWVKDALDRETDVPGEEEAGVA